MISIFQLQSCLEIHTNVNHLLLPTLLASHQSYISLSSWESFGLTLTEAHQAGCHVFADYQSSLPEIHGAYTHFLHLSLDGYESTARTILDTVSIAPAKLPCLSPYTWLSAASKWLRLFTKFL